MALVADALVIATIVALGFMTFLEALSPRTPVPDLPPDESALLGVDQDD